MESHQRIRTDWIGTDARDPVDAKEKKQDGKTNGHEVNGQHACMGAKEQHTTTHRETTCHNQNENLNPATRSVLSVNLLECNTKHVDRRFVLTRSVSKRTVSFQNVIQRPTFRHSIVTR